MKEFNHSRLLGAMAGQAGDYFIGTDAITTKKFSHIVIGHDGATVTVCKIRGIDVVTARNYGALPPGYVICAGGDDYIDAITLSAGSALGLLYAEETAVIFDSVTISANGTPDDEITVALQYDNAGAAGSVPVEWRIKNSAGEIVDSGSQVLYFLPGADIAQALAGITYPDAGEDYTLEARPYYSETWTASGDFDSTTTAAPTTTGETTTAAPTTTEETTTAAPTTTEVTTTAAATTSTTTEAPTTTGETTTAAPTTSTTTEAPTTTGETTTAAPTTTD
jgi:hypothetical protein